MENPKHKSRIIDMKPSSSRSNQEEFAEAERQKLGTLESDLSADPSNYDTHVKYIKLLRGMGEKEKLRAARNNMFRRFPLTPDMWLEWAKDEVAAFSDDSNLDLEKVEKFFERGIYVYLSIPFWLEYLMFVQQHDPKVRELSPDGISKARHLFERAVDSTRLHIPDGSQIWDAYVQFEQTILQKFDHSDIQIQRIRDIFRRQLSFPYQNSGNTLDAYKDWEKKQGNASISSEVLLKYQKAVTMYQTRVDLETGISREDLPESDRIQNFISYLAYEQDVTTLALAKHVEHPVVSSRVVALFERAIACFPFSKSLWTYYVHYYDEFLKAGKDVLKKVYYRATRHCPSVGKFRDQYLLCLEPSYSIEQLPTLESDLSATPYNYDAHVQYIKLLQKMGETEKLRAARNNMYKLFPLTPDMWLEWAVDEAAALSDDSDFETVEKLFKGGIYVYLSIPFWLEYLKFVQQHDPKVRELSPDGISKARDLFERAVESTCLHIPDGSQIWDAYTQFEQTILQKIGHSDVQIQRIRDIFRRQLSFPYQNSGNTLDAYKEWEKKQGNASISSEVLLKYQKAVTMYQQRVDLERQISREDLPESDRIQNFISYLAYEQDVNTLALAKRVEHPVVSSRVVALFERAIACFPFSKSLWIYYVHYYDGFLKAGEDVLRKVYCRATRHCPSVGKFWVKYLQCLEQGHASEKEISSVFDMSRKYTFSTPKEHLDLFLTRVDGLRRRISSSTGDVLNYSLIRETFKEAADYLSPQMQNTDDLFRLHAYWARLELKLGNGLVAARDVWEGLLKTCDSMPEAWQGYIAMEVELGNINEARAIYERCYNKEFIGNGSKDICHAWLYFEREFGTLQDLEHAVQEVDEVLWELKAGQELESCDEATYQRDEKTAREKRKSHSSAIDKPPPAKRQKNAPHSKKKLLEMETDFI